MTSLGRTVTISFWAAFALSHFYLGFRLYTWVLAPVCRFPLWILACLMLFLGGSFQAGHNARKWPLWLRRFLIAVGGHWAGALLPLLLGFVGLDVLRLLFLLGGIVFPSYLLLCASLAILATVSLLLIWGTLCAVRPRVTRYTIPVHKKAGTLSSLRVALISDVHLGVSIDAKQLRAMCQALQDLSPDLILIAGDLLDSGLPGLHDADKIQSVLSDLHAPHGVYICLGNHDVRGGVTTEETIRFFQRCGLSVLHDSAVHILDSYTLIGRADYGFSKTAGAPRASVAELVHGVDLAQPILLVDHQPNQLVQAADAGVDVQFSGHTHRGQMFPISLLTRHQFETDFGVWKHGRFTAVVSSGYGTWGPRLRLGSHSELVLATLVFDA